MDLQTDAEKINTRLKSSGAFDALEIDWQEVNYEDEGGESMSKNLLPKRASLTNSHHCNSVDGVRRVPNQTSSMSQNRERYSRVSHPYFFEVKVDSQSNDTKKERDEDGNGGPGVRGTSPSQSEDNTCHCGYKDEISTCGTFVSVRLRS